jgi:hypothetical protein
VCSKILAATLSEIARREGAGQQIRFVKVKAHTQHSDAGNDTADRLAKRGVELQAQPASTTKFTRHRNVIVLAEGGLRLEY